VASVTVFALPSVSVVPQSICNGATATLVATGANTYTWTNSVNSISLAVSPTTTTTYSVIGTSTDGCVGNTVLTTVTVTAAPTIAVNSATVCNGQSATLTATGVNTYTWSNSLGNTSSVVVSPTASTVYTITGNQTGCSVLASNTAAVLVNPRPVITISSPTAICNGQSATVLASGADTYSWNTTATTASILVSPGASVTYTATGTFTATGCSNSKSVFILVNSLPTVTATGTLAVCNGNAALINASGASSYSWSNGAGSSSISVTPSVNTIYTVTGIDNNNCSSTAVAEVSVGALPNLTVSQGSICAGQSYTLTPSGAVSYTFSNGAAVVTPSATTVYTITGTNAGGCTVSVQTTLTVNANPTISAGPDQTAFRDDNFQLAPTATGAATYSWEPATALTNPTVLLASGKAVQSTQFMLIAFSAAGCKATSTVNLLVEDGVLNIANYMSPNGDGFNDTWKVNNPNLIKDMSVSIVDQWGNTVYSKSSNYNNEWDGGSGSDKVPDGVYYYILSSNGKVKYSGSITLLR
jgi:gliding motility-associated-like protein